MWMYAMHADYRQLNNKQCLLLHSAAFLVVVKIENYQEQNSNDDHKVEKEMSIGIY